jgi:hypothetical protein
MAKLMLVMKTLALMLTAPKLASRPPSAAITAKTTDSAATTSGAGRQALGGGGRGYGQAEHEQGADHLGGAGDGQGEHDQEQQAEPADRDTAGLGGLRVDGGEQQRPVPGGHHGSHQQVDDDQDQQLAAGDAEDVAEQDVGRSGGEALVEAEQQDADAHPEGEDGADRGVAFARAGAEGGDQHGDHQGTGQRPGDGVVCDEKAGGGAGEGQFGGAVHGEGHAPDDHEGGDEAASDRDQRRGDQRVLGEWLGEQEPHCSSALLAAGSRPGVAPVVTGGEVMVPGGVLPADDDDAVVHPDHVDVRAVQGAEPRGASPG